MLFFQFALIKDQPNPFFVTGNTLKNSLEKRFVNVLFLLTHLDKTCCIKPW